LTHYRKRAVTQFKLQTLDPARLRFSGLQKDSSRAQSCPSKHPDGYVEALFWRPFPASSGR